MRSPSVHQLLSGYGSAYGSETVQIKKGRIFLIKASNRGKMAVRGDHDELIYVHQPSHRQCSRLR